MKFNMEFAESQLARINNEDALIEDIDCVNKAFNQVIYSLYENTPQVELGEVFIETLATKISLTTRSILQLTKGIYAETNTKVGTILTVDFPSIHILARSIIEAFLTSEYLFYNDLEKEERHFRFIIWQLSGYKSRANFFSGNGQQVPAHINEKLEQEKKQIEILLEQAKKFQYFDNLKKNDLWKLDAYGVPRLKSWMELLNASILKPETFLLPYKLYSNYAHSEFISLIQMNGSDVFNKGSELNTLHLKNVLRVVLCINCVAIIQLRDKFKNTREEYNLLSKEQKLKIEFWRNFSVGAV